MGSNKEIRDQLSQKLLVSRVDALLQLHYKHSEIAELLSIHIHTVKNITKNYKLKIEHNYTFQEIAEEMNISVDSVYRLYKSAIRKMKQRLTDDEPLCQYFTDCLIDFDNPQLPPLTYDP